MPVIADATSGGNVGSATMSYANYTKVGNKVTVAAQLVNINTTGMTGANVFYCRGLPFASGSQFSAGSCNMNLVTFQAARTAVISSIAVSDTWLSFTQLGSGLSGTATDVNDINGATSDIYFSLTYFTNA